MIPIILHKKMYDDAEKSTVASFEMPKGVPTSTNERLIKAIIMLSIFAVMVYLAGM